MSVAVKIPIVLDVDAVSDFELVLVLDELGQSWTLVASTIDWDPREPFGLI